MQRSTLARGADPQVQLEAQLVERMLARDPSAWREFQDRYDGLIHRVIRRIAPASLHEERLEIRAVFYLGLNQRDMRQLRVFDPDLGYRLSTWVGMLTTRCAIDYLRRVSRRPPAHAFVDAERVGSTDDSPFEDVVRSQRRAAVESALRSFSSRDRSFVRLYFQEGLAPEAVATRMGISVNTVYSKRHKIQRRLEEMLAPVRTAA